MVRTLAAPAALTVLLLTAPGAHCSTIIVPWDYPTIGEAVLAASEGDSILVHPGTYSGPENRGLDFAGRNLTLLAIGGPDVTVIDCEGADRGLYFHTGEDSTSLVSGFTVRNGSAARGGGVYCGPASPVIEGCVFEHNTVVEAGGGVYCVDSEATVRGCEFVGNTVTTPGFGHGGGGMQCNSCAPTVSSCDFIGNSASSGGGLYCVFGSSPTVTDCTFKENVAYAYHGGGLFCYDYSSPTVSGCDFVLNDAERNGGGMYCEDSFPEVTSCTFEGNRTLVVMYHFGGGGVCLVRSAPTILECEFLGNDSHYGGGINCRDNSHPGVFSCTFTSNTAEEGAGVHCVENSQPQLHGNYFQGGHAVSGGGIYAEDAGPGVSDCLFVGNSSTGASYVDGGGGVHVVSCEVSIDDCAFVSNNAIHGGAVYVGDSGTVSLFGTTVAGSVSNEGSGVYCYRSYLTVANCILAFGEGEAVSCPDIYSVAVACTDIFGNVGGDWTGCIASYYGVDGNISEDPLFCGGASIDEAYMLQQNSPCAADNSPCGQMGKWGVGCPATAVEATSWGGIKAMYR